MPVFFSLKKQPNLITNLLSQYDEANKEKIWFNVNNGCIKDAPPSEQTEWKSENK